MDKQLKKRRIDLLGELKYEYANFDLSIWI